MNGIKTQMELTIIMMKMVIILKTKSKKLGIAIMDLIQMEKCMQIPHSIMQIKSITQKQMEVFVRTSGVIRMVGCIVEQIERVIRMEFMR